MNIVELLQAHATRTPHAPAIVDKRVTTFADLEQESAKRAALLAREGLRPGDTVLVFYPMSAELYITLIAIFRLGLVAMFLDPSAGREHIEQCCALHPPQALIASPKAHLLRFVSPALRRIPKKFSIGTWVPRAISVNAVAGLKPASAIVAATEETPALITFTSGSTGQPKAAMRTHGFLLAQHRVLQQSLGLTAGAIDLTTLPIFVLANLASGVQSVLPAADLRFPGAIDPAPVIQQIHTHQPVSTAASPALLERIADMCLSQQIQLPSLQKIFTGGAPVFPRLLDKLQTIAPQANIVAVYGSTEAEPIAEIAYHEMNEVDLQAMLGGRGLLAGKPVPAIELRILRDQWSQPVVNLTPAAFDAACLSSGEPGEIVVSGAHVLSGYLHGQGNEETKFRVADQVWHRTGDAGYLDDAGRVWLLGRCSAKIEDEHGTLFPFAVECAATHHQHVKRAALVLQQTQRVLVVELARGGQLNGLQKTLAWAKLAAIRVVPRIPVDKRHNAKVDYPALQKLL